jgi:hypothetical protein
MSLETEANALGLRIYRTRQEINRLTVTIEQDERKLDRMLDLIVLIYANEDS